MNEEANMSELQDFVDENEIGYQFALLDVKNAIDTYGIEIVFQALDLTSISIPDKMVIQ
jgi:hypothetical protein